MVKRKLLSVFWGLLLLASVLGIPPNAMAATLPDEVSLAQQAGQRYVAHVAAINPNLQNWAGASLSLSQKYSDMNSNKQNAFMFAIQQGKDTVGHVLVGNAEYGFPVFEAGQSQPPAVPRETVRLVYLGPLGQYALTRTDGQLVGVNLEYGDKLGYSAMKSWLPSATEYRANVQLGETAQRAAAPNSLLFTYNCLIMWYYRDIPNGRVWCGPCSGVSIEHYYRGYSSPNYSALPDDPTAYDYLYQSMHAQPWVIPSSYGPGWTELAVVSGYSNFRGDWYPSVGPAHYFNRIVPDIDSGWPHALCCYFQDAHYFAIKGYDYSTGQHMIICTDSEYADNWKQLNWDSLPSSYHDTIRIRDR